MRISDILFAVLALTLFVSGVCVWFYPSVQDFVASNIMWNGIRDFSTEFNANTIDSAEDLYDMPEDSILVAIPYLEYSDEELSHIKEFVNNGGMLLLMDDYGFGNTVLAYLGLDVRFANKPLLDPLFCYKNQWMPRITDFTAKVKETGVDAITLNHATALTYVKQQEAIAWSSKSSFLDMNENEHWDESEPSGIFAVAAEYRLGRGILTVVSDPSIIIGSMLGRDDNHNFVEYLFTKQGEQKAVVVDQSHLTKVPLDASKTRLIKSREWLSNPYALLGVVAIVFMVISRYTLYRG